MATDGNDEERRDQAEFHYVNPPATCPICGGGGEFRFIRNYVSSEGRWSLYECAQCSVQFWTPFKNPGNQWYEDLAGYAVRKVEKQKIERGHHKEFLKWLKASNSPKGTLLDLGCSTGEFINEVQKLGWKVWGNDFDRKAIEVAREAFGLKNVYSLNFDDFFKILNLPKFDIVTFFEVLEHVDDPPQFVKNVGMLTRDNGLVVMSTPSRERMLVNNLKADFPLHHLTRWNEVAAQNLFTRFGFTMVKAQYVEQFKFLRDSLAESLRFGFVQKTFRQNTKVGERDIEGSALGSSHLTKIVHLCAHIKDYFIFSIPASILYFLGKSTNRKNGDMMLFFRKSTQS